MLEKTVCELFAGVGGFRLGLERSSSNWQTVWANQWEPSRTKQDAFDCYCSHFGKSINHVNKDICTIDKKTIPNHNLLVGGFPCQDYSVARTQANGIKGKKGILWWEINQIISDKQPAFVLLENVDRLLKSPAKQRGRDFGIMLACFMFLGYSVEWRVINAAEYGCGQRRRRVFIFASRENTKHSKKMSSLESGELVINSMGFFAKTFPIYTTNEITTKFIDICDLLKINDNFKFEFQNAGYASNGSIYTAKVVPIEEHPVALKDLLEKDVDEKYFLNDKIDKWEYLKGGKKIERVAANGHVYIYSEGPIAFPDPIDRPARTMLTSESSLNRSTHVIQDSQTGKLRLLTPVEAERIQGFDDNWTNTGMTEKFRYFCMGNALVVHLVERMGNTLNDIFANEKG